MSEKRYYWLKLQKDFFKRHDIKYIETLPNGREITHFYLKLMVESVDHEGELRFSPELPYSEAMLASVTDTPADIVEAGMTVLKELGLVKIDEDGTIVLPKVVKMIDSAADTDEARRAKRYRERKKAERDETSQENVTGVTDNVTNGHESKSKSKSKSKSIKENVEEKNITPIPPKDDEKLLTDSEKMFLEFWAAYPKKVDKQGCERAFKRIPKLKEVFPSIMAALEIQKQSEQWTKAHGQYIPNPLTYIHQERWLTVSEKDEMQVKIDEVVKQNYQKFLF